MRTWLSRSHFLIITALFVLVHLAMFSIYGLRSLYDGVGYVISANELINDGSLVKGHNFFYSLHVIILAAFILMFDSVIPFLMFQVVVSYAAVLFFYRAISHVFNRDVALIGAVILVTWWDHIHWNSTTMTESLFLSVSCFLLYRLAVFSGRRGDYLAVGSLLLVSLLLRPTGIVLVLAGLAFIFAFRWPEIRSNPAVATMLFVTVFALILFCANTLLNIWDFSDQYVRGNIVTYVDQVNPKHLNTSGLRVIPGDTTSLQKYHVPVERMIVFVFHNPVEFLIAGFLKVVYLLSGYRPYYSVLHNVVSVGWGLFLYAAFFKGWSLVSSVPLRIFAVTVVLANCLLIFISSVDWDNRFYIPMVAAIVLISSAGATSWLKRVFPGLTRSV